MSRRTCDFNSEWLTFDMQRNAFFRQCEEAEAVQIYPPDRHLTNRRWGYKMPPGWLWDGFYYTYLGDGWQLRGAYDYRGFSSSVSGTPPVNLSEYRYQVEYQQKRMANWLYRWFPRDRHPASSDNRHPKKRKAALEGAAS
jgi:hypothetical protein